MRRFWPCVASRGANVRAVRPGQSGRRSRSSRRRLARKTATCEGDAEAGVTAGAGPVVDGITASLPGRVPPCRLLLGTRADLVRDSIDVGGSVAIATFSRWRVECVGNLAVGLVGRKRGLGLSCPSSCRRLLPCDHFVKLHVVSRLWAHRMVWLYSVPCASTK